tara:strand:- start:335 stop:499 length:165 start_codon:yes stop_codon:yes gene_type:complete
LIVKNNPCVITPSDTRKESSTKEEKRKLLEDVANYCKLCTISAEEQEYCNKVLK